MSMNEAAEIFALRDRAEALNDEVERRATALQQRAIAGDVEAQRAVEKMVERMLAEMAGLPLDEQ
jgi:hypothetical protein